MKKECMCCGCYIDADVFIKHPDTEICEDCIEGLETEINKPTETKILGVGSGWEPEINVKDIYEE